MQNPIEDPPLPNTIEPVPIDEPTEPKPDEPTEPEPLKVPES